MIATETIEVRSYLRHLGRRWKTLLAVPAVAVAVALLISLILPRKYDARVTLLVQPGASDPRFPPALNQIYLEYLRSYEQVIQSSGLLLRVIQKFNLNVTVDRFRNQALDVEMLRFSKLLTIRVRWDDPQKAHQMALFLAEEAVHAAEGLRNADADRASRQAQEDVQRAQARLDETSRLLLDFKLRTREEELSRAVQVEMDTKSQYERDLAASQILVPELEARASAPTEQARDDAASLAAEKAKQAALRKALVDVEGSLARHQADLLKAQAGSANLERAYRSAYDALTLATARANDARAAATSRSEQLQIADPGIVPQRPSTPHFLFNALLALALGLFAAVIYESWKWSEL
jgi:capsular polysaccharide biosynthesis protein